ncbi:uncharacterized protein LOC129728872 [Wyeomyia smithii]|uniref:uncharacterized protein LOC129728872 n=1 Tax=Wyeomyia smithii TaxID=174621 RepID=UPI00246817CB|nr:uncharacterized protein LOC129728872 [Wyeomyia smithii]
MCMTINHGEHQNNVNCSPKTKRLLEVDSTWRAKLTAAAMDDCGEAVLQEISEFATEMEEHLEEHTLQPLEVLCDVSNEVADEPAYKKRRRPKVDITWDEQNIANLISVLECHECLWNAGNVFYKNRAKRDAAWQEIAENVFHQKYDTAQLNAKWTNLRIQFKSYHSKVKKGGKSGQAALPKTYWKHYGQMLFVSAAEENYTQETESNLDTYLENISDQQITPKTLKKANYTNHLKRGNEISSTGWNDGRTRRNGKCGQFPNIWELCCRRIEKNFLTKRTQTRFNES